MLNQKQPIWTLIVGIGGIIALMFALLYMSWIHDVGSRESHRLLQTLNEKTEQAFIMREAIRKRSFSLSLILTMDDFFDRDEERERFEGYAREFTMAQEKLLSLGIGPEEQDILDKFREAARKGRPTVDNAIEALVEGLPRQQAEETALKAISIQTAQFGRFDKLFAVLKKLEDEERKAAEYEDATEQKMLLIIGSFVFLIGTFIAIIIIRRERAHLDSLENEIAERKKAEDKARDTNALLEARVEERTTQLNRSRNALVEAQRVAAIGSWEWLIPENKIIWSEETFHLLGLPSNQDEPTFKEFLARVHPDDMEPLRNAFRSALRNKEPFDLQFRLIKNDGIILYTHALGKVEFDENGKAVKMLGTLQDINKSRNAELALKKALEEADIANRSKSEMLANMSHELRTPLNAIIGFSSSIREETFGPLGHDKYREYLGDISSSGEHLLDLISDILDVSAIEASKMDLHMEEIDFAELALASKRLVEKRFGERNIELSTEIEEDLPVIVADVRRLKQILLNLLSNAVKFTKPGGVVSLKLSYDAIRGHCCKISDTGIGMTYEEMEKAMSQFGQVSRGSIGRHEGTGLGLPLTKGLVELHNGSFNIESTRDIGTTVTIVFPKVREMKTKLVQVL